MRLVVRERRVVEREAEAFRLLDEPVQRLVRGAVRLVAAADVAVHAREPRLLQLAGPAGRALPQRRRERHAVLVDRERVVRVLDRRAQADVVERVLPAVDELAEPAGRAERPDRVPDTDVPDRGARAAIGLAERDLPFRRVGCDAPLVEAEDLGHEVVVVLVEQADVVHESRQRAHRERAAAETEEIELVARHVVVEQEPVQRDDVAAHAVAERAARELVERPARPDAVEVADHLVRAVGRDRAHRARHLRHVRRPALPGRLVDLVAHVPRAVGADDEPLHGLSFSFTTTLVSPAAGVTSLSLNSVFMSAIA